MENQYRAIFVSDIHLGISAWQSALLEKWLKKHKAEKYYLVGDIVDLWKLKRSWYWPDSHNKLVRRFIKLAEKREVFYIPGNHDSSFRDFVGLKFGGIEVREEMIHECADGQKALVIHGDKFDSIVKDSVWLAKIGAIGYEILFKLNRVINATRRLLGLKRYWSLSAAVKKRVKNAVKYIGRYEETIVEYTKQQGVQNVVCGHIHQSNIQNINGVQYINCGDFVESMTLVVEHFDGRFEIISFTDNEVKTFSEDEEQV